MQLSRRKRAEADNGELRTLLQTQRRKAQYLKRALLKDTDMDAEVMERLLGVNQRNLPSDNTPADNDAVFEELSSKLDETYLEVEAMFDSSAAQAFSPSSTPSRWRTPDADSDVVFTDQECKTVPFHRLIADRAVWESMGERGVRHSKNHFIKSFDVTDNTKSSSWRVVSKRNRLKIDVLVRKVARKFVSENRTVVVCRMLMEPTSLASMSLVGLKYYETRYIVIEPGTSSEFGPKSTIHCYLKVERQSERNGGDERNQANWLGSMSEYEVMTWKGLIKGRNQILENLLLEEACKALNGSTE
ncbi:hypothetical protein BBJ28_00001139 [Nothophytophthora sp. Chile5]|nr:hypothetical protein BBJ28_00001139 [Nothophytophthora sp. Chile5]